MVIFVNVIFTMLDVGEDRKWYTNSDKTINSVAGRGLSLLKICIPLANTIIVTPKTKSIALIAMLIINLPFWRSTSDSG